MTNDSAIDPELASTLRSLRHQLDAALASLEGLERRLTQPSTTAVSKPATSASATVDFVLPQTAEPSRTDVLIHNITAPALARSAQTHLADQPGVTRADVRELAEGLLRITVDSINPLTSGAFGDWEPQRLRHVLTEHDGVLEIKLGGEL